jgi:cytochrome c oxidase cbb3-type subunit 4
MRRRSLENSIMEFTHDLTVWFSKSFGLFYLLGLSLAVLVYVYWPSNKKPFEDAASSILAEEDRPWR